MQTYLVKAAALAFCAALTCATGLHAQTEDFADTDFKKADSIAQLYPNHSLQDLKQLSDKLTTPLATEQEKFRAIYRWICNNIDNDYTLFKKNKHKREKLKDADELKKWNTKFAAVVFQTLLRKHKTVCTGYAYLVKEMAYHAGLPCVVINGYGRTAQANIGGPGIANHSWNAVQIHNKWYLCDATWSSGAVDPEKALFVKKYNDAYFLPDPSLFVRNHYPLDSAWILLQDKPTLQAFLTRPLIYSAIFRYKIDQLFPETFLITAAKEETVSFQFMKSNTHQVEKVELNIQGPKEFYTAHPRLHLDENSQYRIDHTFAWKGRYVVHVLLDDNYTFTYNVQIR
jgi:transglutaminase/protease-like cytokinesis protein 3